MLRLLPLLLALSCAATGVRQGEPLDVQRLLAGYRDNAAATHSRWEGQYVQLRGTVVETGLEDRLVTRVVVAGNRYYAAGRSTDELVKVPFVTFLAEGADARVKCVLEEGWGGDLAEVHRGGSIRVSAHFVSLTDGSPAQLVLKECRVREAGAAPPPPTAASL
jgi:hypothetical protein